MDQVEHVKKLREEYERALDAAESRRSAYHEAVLDLYRGATPLREIAQELGLSHQRVHQIVSGDPPRRSKLPRAAGGAAAIVLILAAATFGALRLAHAPPFNQGTRGSHADIPSVSVPNVLNEPESVAVRRLENAGLRVRVVRQARNVSLVSSNRVYRQSGAAGEHVEKGSLVTLFVAIQYHWGAQQPSFVAARRVGGFRPGGAVFRRKREVLVRETPLGRVSLWRAPDRVSRSARCSWLQIGRTGAGGSCYQPPRRGLPQVVMPVLRFRKNHRTGWLPVIWGRVGPNVAQLTVVFKDGTRTDFAAHDGMFLHTVPIPQSRWVRRHRPVFLVARDADGRVIDKRPFLPNALSTPY